MENSEQTLKIIECPRDAMQGIHQFIPTEDKIKYINQLLRVGYHTIDCGSFVSPKAIPQMSDTKEVIKGLDLSDTDTKLSTIVANLRGANDAKEYEEVDILGFPFSISETFQRRNTNTSIAESFDMVKSIQDICLKANKKLLIYISMGFGNPYGDPWNVEICQEWVDNLAEVGVKIIALSDTIGVANPQSIKYLYKNLIPPYPDVEFGAHFHTRPDEWREKIESAYSAGCMRYDGAIKGYGGCPMAKDDLTGNMPTENLYYYFEEQNVETGLSSKAFVKAMGMAPEIFPL